MFPFTYQSTSCEHFDMSSSNLAPTSRAVISHAFRNPPYEESPVNPRHPNTQCPPLSVVKFLKNNFKIHDWLRGQDLNLRPSGYEPDELPDCSTPRPSSSSSEPPNEATSYEFRRTAIIDISDQLGQLPFDFFTKFASSRYAIMRYDIWSTHQTGHTSWINWRILQWPAHSRGRAGFVCMRFYS